MQSLMNFARLTIRLLLSFLSFFSFYVFFFFNDTAATEIYTLSYTTLFRSDFSYPYRRHAFRISRIQPEHREAASSSLDRKSTRLNSSHVSISYAVFCLKKKLSFYMFSLCSFISSCIESM